MNEGPRFTLHDLSGDPSPTPDCLHCHLSPIVLDWLNAQPASKSRHELLHEAAGALFQLGAQIAMTDDPSDPAKLLRQATFFLASIYSSDCAGYAARKAIEKAMTP